MLMASASDLVRRVGVVNNTSDYPLHRPPPLFPIKEIITYMRLQAMLR
jgi:hypothetical protein